MSFNIIETATVVQIMAALFSSDSGISIRNEALRGDERCAALFSGSEFAITDTTIDFPSSGFILGTGDANKLPKQGGSFTYSNFLAPGDDDFNPFDPAVIPSHDACVLEFEFLCSPDYGADLTIDYSFASDEYRNAVDAYTGLADRFGFLLNGENIAKVPGSSEDVSLYSVNHANNTEFYEYNPPRAGQRRFPMFEPDGFTVGLSATGTVDPGWNTLKIGIIDIHTKRPADSDSWLFIKESSFSFDLRTDITREPTAAPTISHAPSSVPSSTPSVSPSKITQTPSVSPRPPPDDLIGDVGDPTPSPPPTRNDPSANTGGDPHFQTFDKQLFSFHGQCDLVLTRSKSYNNGLGLHVHIRTTRVDKYSYISTAAIKVGVNIFEVSEEGELFINGKTFSPSPSGMSLEGIQSITKVLKGSQKRIIVHNFDFGNKKNIEIRANVKANMLFVDINGAFEDTEGLLGAAPEYGKPLLARDGITDLSGHWNTYGEEWQVNNSDPKLFRDMSRHPQYPKGCVYDALDGKNGNSMIRGSRYRRRLMAGNTVTVSLEEATKACAHLNGQMKSFCVDDVMATGDLELVEDPFYVNQ